MEKNGVEPKGHRGVEWEVVSPTTSIYVAAPSTEQVECDPYEDQTDNTFRSLFMSGHFVFPPSQHENLPIEPEMEEDIMDETAILDEKSLASIEVQLPEQLKDDKQKEAHEQLPCNAWWKRRAVSLYKHAKDANAFWSIFVAAAVTGLVIIGQQWQKERWQLLQLKWRIIIEEKMGRLLGPPYVSIERCVRGWKSTWSFNRSLRW